MAEVVRRRDTNPAPTITNDWTLPTDLVLDIVARSDPATLVRCAATCKLLRRDILHPSFVRYVTREGGTLPSRLLAYLHICSPRDRNTTTDPSPLTLVHPDTPAASRFLHDKLPPYLLCRVTNLLRRYDPITSRGGLVALRRHPSERGYDLCVYNLITGDCTYLSNPPTLSTNWHDLTCVLLTAADGIGCSFLLLVAEVTYYSKSTGRGIRVQTAAPSSNNGREANWGAASRLLPFWPIKPQRHPAVVLRGGVVHWLLSNNDKVLTYDVRTERLGNVELPPTNQGSQRILGTSPDGKLRFLVVDELIISVWLHLSDVWVLEAAAIDAEEKLRSLPPHGPPGLITLDLERYWERSNVVLMRAYYHGLPHLLVVFDLETKEFRTLDLETKEFRTLGSHFRIYSYPFLLLEVDLPTRLQSMRIFS